MRKTKLKDFANRKELTFPIELTIRYSNSGSSMRLIKTMQELKEFVLGGEIPYCEVKSEKLIEGILYVDTMSPFYVEQVMDTYKYKKKRSI